MRLPRRKTASLWSGSTQIPRKSLLFQYSCRAFAEDKAVWSSYCSGWSHSRRRPCTLTSKCYFTLQIWSIMPRGRVISIHCPSSRWTLRMSTFRDFLVPGNERMFWIVTPSGDGAFQMTWIFWNNLHQIERNKDSCFIKYISENHYTFLGWPQLQKLI